MPVAGTVETGHDQGTVEARWWLRAPVLDRAVRDQIGAGEQLAYYRLGDAVLQLVADDPLLLDLFRQLYGDCAVPAPVGADGPLICCAVRQDSEPGLLRLTFRKGRPPDPAGLALTTLHPPPNTPRYEVRDSPFAGWRLVGHENRPVVVACDRHVLIDEQGVPPHFVPEYLVSAMLAAQPELLGLHAASVRVGEMGLLVAGPSHAGKTTTSLHLAARGHALLGDELAVVRLATRQILPLRRTMNLRPGPRASTLTEALSRRPSAEGPPVGERWIKPVRIDRLFPDVPAHPVTLRALFYLNGFGDRASVEPFELTLQREVIFESLSGGESLASWGLVPQRRALRLLAFWQLLRRVPCWLLNPGPPDETAELIERAMEGLECSP
jgi:hypothetical protein